MNNLICRMGSSVSEPSVYYIDGVKSQYSGTADQNLAASLLSGEGGLCLFRHKSGSHTSSPFLIRFYHNFLVVCGSGSSTTCISDRHSYFFITKSKNPKRIILLFQEYVKELDLVPDKEDIVSLKRTLLIIKFSIILLCLILIICLVLFM